MRIKPKKKNIIYIFGLFVVGEIMLDLLSSN